MLKHETLHWLSDVANTAQYVCVADPNKIEKDNREKQYKDNELSYTVVSQAVRNIDLSSEYRLDVIVDTLKSCSPVHAVSIRTFTEDKPSGNPFLYNCKDTFIAVEQITNWIEAGYYVIINETIPTVFNSVNGVIYDNTISFTVGDTPRFVDNAKTKQVEPTYPLYVGISILKTLYGQDIDFSIVPSKGYRVEFTIYPKRVGYKSNQVLFWEYSKIDKPIKVTPSYNDNNSISRYIGNKAYGLLLASAFGVRVPKSVVYHFHSEHVLNYNTWTTRKDTINFGFTNQDDIRAKDDTKVRVRTSPVENTPGIYPTLILNSKNKDQASLDHEVFKFVNDQYAKSNGKVSVCILQNELHSKYSGTALCKHTDKGYELEVEGVSGDGEAYMLGENTTFTVIPKWIETQIQNQCVILNNHLDGSVDIKLEWVASDKTVYIVQLQFTKFAKAKHVIYEGSMKDAIVFKAELGLVQLTNLVNDMLVGRILKKPIILEGNVGIGSHLADVLRINCIPSIIKPLSN